MARGDASHDREASGACSGNRVAKFRPLPAGELRGENDGDAAPPLLLPVRGAYALRRLGVSGECMGAEGDLATEPDKRLGGKRCPTFLGDPGGA